MINVDAIPESLKKLDQWVCWKYEKRGGKPTKVPVSASGQLASSTDPATWSTFDVACAAVKARGFAGIGFVFAESDPFVGIDFDDCIQADGLTLEPWAVELLTVDLAGTYAEISPSGRGVKVFVIADNPLDRGRNVRFPDGGGLEMYSKGRFFTVTGDVFTPGEPVAKQSEIESIVERYFPPDPIPLPFTPRLDIDSDVKASRAAGYIREMTPSIAGERGHDKLFAAAARAVVDFDLDDATAFEILMIEFNPRCLPEWTERDVRRKVEQAGKQPGERGRMLAVDDWSTIGDGPGDWMTDSEMKSLVGPQVITGRFDEDDPEPIEEAGLFPSIAARPPGLIAAVMDYTDSQSFHKQPRMSLAGALALVSTITGRRLTDQFGTRTNLYVLALAPSGAGKDASRKANKKILRNAGGVNRIGPERFGSSAGIVSAVDAEPAILFQIDEIGKLLASLKGRNAPAHLANIATVLMQLYTSSDDLWIGDAYADLTRTKSIEEPHAVVYGSSVADGFWNNLTAENITDGLLGRMLPIEVVSRVKHNRDRKKAEPSKEIIDAVRRWLPQVGSIAQKVLPFVDEEEEEDTDGVDLRTLAPSMTPAKLIEAPHTAEASKRHLEHMEAISDRQINEPEKRAAIWARTGERTSKLTLIFAASRCWKLSRVTIEIEDIDRAIALSNWVTRSIIQKTEIYVSENETEGLVKKALRVIADSPGRSIGRSAFTRKTQWLKKREREEILASLIEGGSIECVFEAATNVRGPSRQTLKAV